MVSLKIMKIKMTSGVQGSHYIRANKQMNKETLRIHVLKEEQVKMT